MVTRATVAAMSRRIVQTIPMDHSEHDRLVTDWLEAHHIRAENVRGYNLERTIGEVEVLTLEVITSGVAEIQPAPGPIASIPPDWTQAEADAFVAAWRDRHTKPEAQA
jgi:phage baseplate assembly protein gpV